MRHYLYFFLLCCVSCLAPKPQYLDDNDQLAVLEPKEKGLPVLLYRSGLIDDFQEELDNWSSTNEDLLLTRSRDTFKVFSTFTGDSYNFINRKTIPLDFSTMPVLSIRAKAEGGSSPILRASLKDANGYIAHEPPVENKILNDGKYRTYYFDFSRRWKQSFPDTAVVDSTLITDILFFINPGGPEYHGKIMVKEVRAVNVGRAKPKEKIIDDFETRFLAWWTDPKIKISIKEANSNSLLVEYDSVGPGYENFGREI